MTTLFQRVGPYEIVREIGRGGMATVFLAEDTRHSRKVALKLVSMTDDREGREILDAERWGAQLQGRLAETCGLVPRVYEAGEHPPYYFIAMEYVDGENLSDVIGRGKVAAEEASRIACELCRFLDTAHRFGTSIDGRDFVSLVHGDLKPRNVRLSPAGDIKVLDFGIAKALSLSRKVTRNDFGSMPYLSPERLESTDVNAHADLWALGVILYELLSGAPPFHALDTRRLEQQIRAGYQRRPLTAPCPPCRPWLRGCSLRSRRTGTSRPPPCCPTCGSFNPDSRQRRKHADFPAAPTRRRRAARTRRPPPIRKPRAARTRRLWRRRPHRPFLARPRDLPRHGSRAPIPFARC
jgi:serine/threonine protein kinase